MTEIRFKLREIDFFDNGKWITYGEVVDLLNKLNDDCEFLEIENEALKDAAIKYAEFYHQALKENEQLKKEKRLLARFIRRNHDVTMISRILNDD